MQPRRHQHPDRIPETVNTNFQPSVTAEVAHIRFAEGRVGGPLVGSLHSDPTLNGRLGEVAARTVQALSKFDFLSSRVHGKKTCRDHFPLPAGFSEGHPIQVPKA